MTTADCSPLATAPAGTSVSISTQERNIEETNHLANSGRPGDAERAAYDEHYGQLARGIPKRLVALEPEDADVADVARRIVEVVDMAQGTRPFRVFIDPTNDGAEVVSAVADRLGVEFFRRAGLTELLGAQSSL